MYKIILLLLLFPSALAAQVRDTPILTCLSPGIGVIPGTPIKFDCGTNTTLPPPTPPPPPTGGCSSNQTGTWGLTRQCIGVVSYQPGAPLYTIQFNDSRPMQYLADVLGGGAWLDYAGEQWAWYTSIQTGSYIALAFTPTRTDITLNFNANPTYGDGGVISISTSPGVFDSSAICVYANGGRNNLSIGSAACPVTVGQTYYINIADVTTSGSPRCNTIRPWLPQTCTVSTIAYTVN